MRATGPTPAVREIVYARAGYACEVCGDTYGPFLTHHRRPRGMGGTRRLDTNSPSNLLLLCDPCHLNVESFRDRARAMKWLVVQHHDPALTPVRLRHGWTYLTPDGGYAPAPNSHGGAA